MAIDKKMPPISIKGHRSHRHRWPGGQHDHQHHCRLNHPSNIRWGYPTHHSESSIRKICYHPQRYQRKCAPSQQQILKDNPCHQCRSRPLLHPHQKQGCICRYQPGSAKLQTNILCCPQIMQHTDATGFITQPTNGMV